jgi:hypothetical protein
MIIFVTRRDALAEIIAVFIKILNVRENEAIFAINATFHETLLFMN